MAEDNNLLVQLLGVPVPSLEYVQVYWRSFDRNLSQLPPCSIREFLCSWVHISRTAHGLPILLSKWLPSSTDFELFDGIRSWLSLSMSFVLMIKYGSVLMISGKASHTAQLANERAIKLHSLVMILQVLFDSIFHILEIFIHFYHKFKNFL